MSILIHREVHILIVEDSPTDVLLAQEALSNVTTPNRVHVAQDGIEATEFLRHEGAFTEAPRPDLIFLDLNMPRKSGHEVLLEIKADERWRNIPVVILTTSKADADIAKAYGNYANCYIVKPAGFDDFSRSIQAVVDFWFGTATLAHAEMRA